MTTTNPKLKSNVRGKIASSRNTVGSNTITAALSVAPMDHMEIFAKNSNKRIFQKLKNQKKPKKRKYPKKNQKRIREEAPPLRRCPISRQMEIKKRQ